MNRRMGDPEERDGVAEIWPVGSYPPGHTASLVHEVLAAVEGADTPDAVGVLIGAVATLAAVQSETPEAVRGVVRGAAQVLSLMDEAAVAAWRIQHSDGREE